MTAGEKLRGKVPVVVYGGLSVPGCGNGYGKGNIHCSFQDVNPDITEERAYQFPVLFFSPYIFPAVIPHKPPLQPTLWW